MTIIRFLEETNTTQAERYFTNDGVLSITERWDSLGACTITCRLFDDLLEPGGRIDEDKDKLKYR